MGRTFGLVIVSIGLWLVFSLPTRAPVPDQRGSTVAGTPEYTSRPAVPTALLAPVAAAVTADAPTTAIRTTAADTTVVARPSRTLGERNHAARSREIESEPEAAMQRPPEPVALTISAANLVAAGTNQNSPSTAEQAIPAPKPVARRDARALPKPEMKNGAAGMTAQKADAGPGAPLAPGSQSPGASTPGSLTQAAIKVPRIFEVVRRDLAASGHVSLAARPQTSGPSALSSANPGPHPPMVAHSGCANRGKLGSHRHL